MTIKSISRIGIILALLIVTQLMKIVIPDLPNGLGDLFVLLEIIIIVSSISISWYETLIATLMYITVIAWTAPSIFIVGITYVNGTSTRFFVYLLDYFFPLILLSFSGLINFRKSSYYFILVPFLIIVNYLLHSWSGVVFWGSYAWEGWGVYTYSFAANAIRSSVLLATAISILYSALRLKKHFGTFVNYGYLNTSEKKAGFIIKTSNDPHLKNLENEALFYNKLNIHHTFEENKLQREWIKGKPVGYWSKKKLVALKKSIKEFRSLDPNGIKRHDWTIYDDYNHCIDPRLFDKFSVLRKQYINKNLVPSHNDINKHNVLWNKQKIILIDFEWSNLNHFYFDYVQFLIADHKLLIEKNQEFNDIYFISLVFFLLWSFKMGQSKFILKQRRKYIKLLSKINYVKVTEK